MGYCLHLVSRRVCESRDILKLHLLAVIEIALNIKKNLFQESLNKKTYCINKSYF